MSRLTVEQRLKYIEDLPLADADISPALIGGEEKKKGAAVDAGSVVSFVANVGLQHRQDLLNSTLYAQLGANAAFKRVDQPVEWYAKYIEILENVGWVIQSFDFTKYDGRSASFEMDTVLLELLAALITEEEELVITEAINALKALSEDGKAATIFESSSHDLTKANAQLGVADDESGVLFLKMAFFYLHTGQNMTRVLWFTFNSADTEMYKATQTINLNEMIYDEVREKIIEKLGERAKKYIDDLPLAD